MAAPQGRCLWQNFATHTAQLHFKMPQPAPRERRHSSAASQNLCATRVLMEIISSTETHLPRSIACQTPSTEERFRSFGAALLAAHPDRSGPHHCPSSSEHDIARASSMSSSCLASLHWCASFSCSVWIPHGMFDLKVCGVSFRLPRLRLQGSQ